VRRAQLDRNSAAPPRSETRRHSAASDFGYFYFWGGGSVSRRRSPETEKKTLEVKNNNNNRDYNTGSHGGMADRDPVPLTAEVRARLAELELELSEGESLNLYAELRAALPGRRMLLQGGGSVRFGSEPVHS